MGEIAQETRDGVSYYEIKQTLRLARAKSERRKTSKTSADDF